MRHADRFSIRQMVELTGLTEFTIRGWENRYSAFRPERSQTGRREYFKGDVERAILLRELLKRGHKIGKVAKLNNKILKALFEGDEKVERENAQDDVPELVSQAMELLALQKWTELKEIFREVPSRDSQVLVHDFILPALKLLAMKIEAGLISLSQEHVFSSFVKEKIYSVLSELENSKRTVKEREGFRFVLAAPEGDFHEIGLLLAHLIIRSYGFISLFLGPHTPSRDLSETALRFEASHLLIVSTVSKKGGARQELLSYVSNVQLRIGTHLQLLIAGSQAPSIENEKRSAIHSIRSFDHLKDYLEELRYRN